MSQLSTSWYIAIQQTKIWLPWRFKLEDQKNISHTIHHEENENNNDGK